MINHSRHVDADESLLTNGYLESTVIDWIPGMPPICLGDVSSFLRTTDPDDFCLRFNESEANRCTSAGALILNTFEGLEADVLAALRAEYPRVYTVGPLGTLLRRTLNGGGGGLSLWKQDAECVASSRGWICRNRAPSCTSTFGSHTVVTPEQLAEFAWGLAATGQAATRFSGLSGTTSSVAMAVAVAVAAACWRLTRFRQASRLRRQGSAA